MEKLINGDSYLHSYDNSLFGENMRWKGNNPRLIKLGSLSFLLVYAIFVFLLYFPDEGEIFVSATYTYNEHNFEIKEEKYSWDGNLFQIFIEVEVIPKETFSEDHLVLWECDVCLNGENKEDGLIEGYLSFQSDIDTEYRIARSDSGALRTWVAEYPVSMLNKEDTMYIEMKFAVKKLSENIVIKLMSVSDTEKKTYDIRLGLPSTYEWKYMLPENCKIDESGKLLCLQRGEIIRVTAKGQKNSWYSIAVVISGPFAGFFIRMLFDVIKSQKRKPFIGEAKTGKEK